MSRSLPENAVAVLAGRFEAQEILQHLSAAFWLHGRDDHTALFLLNKAHENFAALADAMGYTIMPKAATKPRRIIAERDQLGSFVGWRAHCDDLGADTSPYGYGPTEAEAIDDLQRQLDEMEAAA